MPTEIRPVRTDGRLSVVLSSLAKSRVQPVLVYFEIERALRDSQVFGRHRQVAPASHDRRADGVALDGVEIPARLGVRRDAGLASRGGDRASDLLQQRGCCDGVVVG